MKIFLLIYAFFACEICLADVLPVTDKKGRRLLPDEQQLEFDSEYKRFYESNLEETKKVLFENEGSKAARASGNMY